MVINRLRGYVFLRETAQQPYMVHQTTLAAWHKNVCLFHDRSNVSKDHAIILLVSSRLFFHFSPPFYPIVTFSYYPSL